MSEDRANIRGQYLEQMVESASQEGLLMLLVDGAVNFIRRAIHSMETDKLEDVNQCLIKAQNIYLELVVTMDLDAGDFAESMANVYQYLYNLLIEANLYKDFDKMKSCLKLAEDIREIWKETIDRANSGDEPGDRKTAPSPSDPVDVTEVLKKKTGVYEPAGSAGIAESENSSDDIPSRLNITG